jgi:hypothetical protein
MGLSIHYNGRFNKDAILSDMITEVKDIAATFKWDYNIYQKVFPANKNVDLSYDGEIYGISFTPPKCETVSICFLSNYRMSDYVHLKFYGQSENQPESDFLYMLSVKTQFAGSTIHKTIIELFRHLLKRNYFSEFNLVDEGKYWETGDERLLDETFKLYGDLIESFSLALETTPGKQGESFENYFERILKIIDGKKNNSPNS